MVLYRDGPSLARYDLHIRSVTVQDAGVYTCVDEAGMGMSANATLSVLPYTATQLRETTHVLTTTHTLTISHSLLSTHEQGASLL